MIRLLSFVAFFVVVWCSPSATPRQGGIHEAGKDSEKANELALFSIDDINDQSNSYYRSKLVEVKTFHTQVVGGIRYYLDIIIAETGCTKHDDRDLSQCQFSDNGRKEICSIQIWERVWENFREVEENTCKPLKPTIPYSADFDAFIARYNKTYEKGSDEYNLRYKVYMDNVEKIALLNEYEQGTATYGQTIFADMTYQEFKKTHTSGSMKPKYNPIMKQAKIPKVAAPTSYDWRDHGAVTPVKNQGSCGSCWAFSTTGNIEGQWAIKKGNLISLSEQELVDCDNIDQGCNGGLPSDAYEAILKLGGLEDEKDYPYRGSGEKCSFHKSEVKVTLTGAVNISSDENDMVSWLAENGPISIGINANAMQFYFGGIAHPWKIFCNPKSLDHGVLIVGYGVRRSKPYWIIKNSWGPSWGVQGYYLVYRGDGVCGLNEMCTSADV